MLKSMTGFAAKEAKIAPFGNITIEFRSTNHKFLEIVLQLPEGLRFLEDKIKKEIEAKIRRGRVICVVNISGGSSHSVFINEELLKGYLSAMKKMKQRFGVQDGVKLAISESLSPVSMMEQSVSVP